MTNTNTIEVSREQVIADTINAQIGSRAMFMMGAHHIYRDGADLVFKIRGSAKVNYIRISLSPLDTYTVTFSKIRGIKAQEVAQREGVYADNLHAVIETETGLYLSL